jgi:hypothetical protein
MWTSLEVELGPDSSLCLSAPRSSSGFVLWTGGVTVRILGCIWGSHSLGLLPCLWLFSFLWEEGYTVRPALVTKGVMSFRDRYCCYVEGAREGEMGTSMNRVEFSFSLLLFIWGCNYGCK